MSTNFYTKYIDLDKIWPDLEEGIRQIYRNDKMPSDRYMNLYYSVYDYCTSLFQPKRHRPANDLSPVLYGSHYVGLSLYTKVNKYLHQYLEQLVADNADLIRDDPLKFYAEEWKKYQPSSKRLNGVFAYLNRHWVRQEVKEKRKAYEVYPLALKVWQDVIFVKMSGEVTDAVLKLIEAQRKGEKVEASFISTTISSFVELGLIEGVNLLIYRQTFEQKFLEETEKFYTKEFDELSSSNFTENIKHIEQRLDEEKYRADFYLPELTNLEALCEKILKQKRLDMILDDFQNLQNADENYDLDDLYNSFAANPSNVKNSIENFIKRQKRDEEVKESEEGASNDVGN